ncbi:MAG TPA: hypothetical protein K8V56_17280 [Sporosarcina psychrophila]|uniref:Uncharacterized protein n=1 Tax=Sporosarcina psychrophila TaxID=1476 RepID=A0A921G1Z4_SPOPS|nr:hypothetical protein [Sporosarcina psychrophila]
MQVEKENNVRFQLNGRRFILAGTNGNRTYLARNIDAESNEVLSYEGSSSLREVAHFSINSPILQNFLKNF